MPPLKEYIFEHLAYSVSIIINSYSIEAAKSRLKQIVKEPNDYKLINE